MPQMKYVKRWAFKPGNRQGDVEQGMVQCLAMNQWAGHGTISCFGLVSHLSWDRTEVRSFSYRTQNRPLPYAVLWS
jgi:hypothetical protein